MPDMFAYRAEKLEGGWSERKILTRFVSPRLLIADEFMLDETTPEETHFLLEQIEQEFLIGRTFRRQCPLCECG
jgi:DNA replication protein DnaC